MSINTVWHSFFSHETRFYQLMVPLTVVGKEFSRKIKTIFEKKKNNTDTRAFFKLHF